MLHFILFILEIDCGIPPTIANGIFQANSYTLNSSAIYKCDENYQLMGHLQITCTESGTWQPQPPICLGNKIISI